MYILIWTFDRGGVLEPEGTVEIKFRKKDLVKTMSRLDDTCRELTQKLNSPNLRSDEKQELEKKLAMREEKLMPMYHTVAVQFADLHDTPGRMEEKGVVSVSRMYVDTAKCITDLIRWLIIIIFSESLCYWNQK